MLHMRNIEVGQGFEYRDRNRSYFGLVIGVTDKHVVFVPVELANQGGIAKMYSYDEHGAEYDRDKNHVRLNDCPPPFSVFGVSERFNGVLKSNAMALADMSSPLKFDRASFDKYTLIVDNGAKVSKRDLRRVFEHPWPVQKEKEKTLSAEEKAKTQRRLAMLDGFPDIKSASTDFNLEL